MHSFFDSKLVVRCGALLAVVALAIAHPPLGHAASDGDSARTEGANGDQSSEDESLSDEEKKKLNRLIGSAREAYNAGEFEEAIPDLRRAYEIDPNPAFHYRIALSYERAGHPEKAIDFYRRFLEQKPDSSKRGQIEATIERLDDESDESGERRAEPSELKQKDGLDRRAILRWSITGLAGASVISLTTFGILFASAKSDYDDERSRLTDMPRSERPPRGSTDLPSLRERRNGRLTGFYVSLGLTAAAGGLATYLWLTRDTKGETRARRPAGPAIVVSPTPEGAAVGLRGRF